MTAIEIILIIIGFICLCVSCFVAKKNSSYAEGEKESLSSDLDRERRRKNQRTVSWRNFIQRDRMN